MVWRYFFAWFLIMILAVINGIIREAVYKTPLGELRAHQVSSLVLILLVALYVWFLVHTWRPATVAQALAIGFMWLIMTVGFESLLGHYVNGLPWPDLFKDYNLLAGRVWVLVLLWITLAPYCFFRLQSTLAVAAP